MESSDVRRLAREVWLRRVAGACVNTANEIVSGAYVSLFPERSSLVAFLFHGLFQDASEIEEEIVDPQHGFTVGQLRVFIEYFLERGFRFVSPADVRTGLDESANHVLITFDDGYFSSGRALPLLKEYGVPAVFFVSTRNVLEGESYWWDVVYRQRRRRGTAIDAISAEQQTLKHRKHREIESHLAESFGREALQPIGDLDRPFTPRELAELAREPGVVVGNHTRSHAILTRYAAHEVEEEISGAQKDLEEITGTAPDVISYPNGDVSPSILRIAHAAGIRVGLTTAKQKNRLPLPDRTESLLSLNRFTLHGDEEITRQCRISRSDLQVAAVIKRWLDR